MSEPKPERYQSYNDAPLGTAAHMLGGSFAACPLLPMAMLPQDEPAAAAFVPSADTAKEHHDIRTPLQQRQNWVTDMTNISHVADCSSSACPAASGSAFQQPTQVARILFASSTPPPVPISFYAVLFTPPTVPISTVWWF